MKSSQNLKDLIKLFLFCLLIPLVVSCKDRPTIQGVHLALGRVESTVSNVNAGTVRPEKVSELAFGGVGRVSRLDVKLGSSVRKDQILAEIENSDLLAMLTLAESETKRQTGLLSAGGSARTQIEKAESLQEKIRGDYEKTLIRAPFDGLITELNLEVGQLSQITAINPKPMMKIVDLEPRYIRAEIDEVDLSKVKLGQIARVKILAARREPFKGVVRKIVPYVSAHREQDRVVEVELDVESEGMLLPAGASADVEVVVEERDNVLCLPARAVLGRGAERFAYLVTEGRLVKIPVQVGLGNYDRVEIITGAKAQDVIALPLEGIELVDGLAVSVEIQSWL